MFIIELTYKAELKRIDAHMGAHMKFLRKYYDVRVTEFRGSPRADDIPDRLA